MFAFVVVVAAFASNEVAASINTPVELRILIPYTGELIHSNQDRIEVHFLVLPDLAFWKGLRIRIILDGRMRPRVRRYTTFTMDHVYRGKHTLQAVHVTKNGRIVAVSFRWLLPRLRRMRWQPV